MQPEHKRSRSQKAGLARARMYMKAHLDWLSGFPLESDAGELRWLYVPPRESLAVQEVRIGRCQLHKASFVFKKLVHRFPRALPKIVGDVQCWSLRVERTLGWIKAAVHDDQPPPACLFDEPEAFPSGTRRLQADLRRKMKSLGPLIDAISWLLHFAPDASDNALHWLRRNGSR